MMASERRFPDITMAGFGLVQPSYDSCIQLIQVDLGNNWGTTGEQLGNKVGHAGEVQHVSDANLLIRSSSPAQALMGADFH